MMEVHLLESPQSRADSAASLVAAVRVVIAGCGGNIGSHLCALLARIPQIEEIILVDPDCYEERNTTSQDIARRDVGRRKVAVQKRRIQQIRPDLLVRALPCRVEDLPLGCFHGALLVSGLDSRESRRVVNEIACRLGLCWVDLGVEAGGLLARLNVYRPSLESACGECAWDQRDYDALEQRYPCQGEVPTPAATDAPAGLGALAASLGALECQKLHAAPDATLRAGYQVVHDLRCHQHHVTRIPRNDSCRFDHATWSIHTIPETPTQLDLPGLAARVLEILRAGSADPVARDRPAPFLLRLEGRPFVRRLHCRDCGRSRATLGLLGRGGRGRRRCRHCRRDMDPGGFDLIDELPLDRPSGAAPDAALSRSFRVPLARLGFLPGDVVSVTAGSQTVHVQLGAASAWGPYQAVVSGVRENAGGRRHDG